MTNHDDFVSTLMTSLFPRFRLVEVTTRHRQEVDTENERAKQAQSQLEKTQLARERAHKQRVRGLEEQVSGLKCIYSQPS